jgi:hypothetical protein
MGRWTDVAPRQETIPNCGPYRMTAHNGVVIHIAQGSYEGTISWFHNPAASTGSHFVVDYDGSIAQLIDTDINSWCQADGNMAWLSVENAGFSGKPLTDAQVAANAKILRKANQVYGVPFQVTNDPYGRGLGHHAMGGVAWGGHFDCPGNPIIAQKSQIVSIAAGGSTLSADTVPAPVDLALLTGGMGPMFFVRLKGKREVFLTNGMQSLWVPNPQTLADYQTLAKEGRLKLSSADVREITNAALLGLIVGTKPAGY